MITNKEYFNHPDFNYDEIKDRLEPVIDEGIEKYGEAYIRLNSEYEAGKVLINKDCECSKGHRIGQATISLRYLGELIYNVSKAGLGYFVSNSSERHRSPTYIVIYVNVEKL